MTVVPVLDLMNGVVVRGVAGRRDEYRPIQSRLVSTPNPLSVACAIRDQLGLNRFYVADLDAILFQRPNDAVWRQLRHEGLDLLIDAGVSDAPAARLLNELGCDLVVGLESLKSPDAAASILKSSSSATFSLDLADGTPMLRKGACGWKSTPLEIARQLMLLGFTRLIVLDLADVGMDSGTRTNSLVESLRAEFATAHLTVGGGVRSEDDLLAWKGIGADAVLVASAIHDRKITRTEIDAAS